MDLLQELYKHPAYKHQDIELARKKLTVTHSVYELKKIIEQYQPTDKVITALGTEHYRECSEAKYRLGADTCGCHCLCTQIHIHHRNAMDALNDIGRTRKCTLL